jgi:hypothetical protein
MNKSAATNKKSNKKTNKTNILTPNEINKFVYCPRQWYYERTFGQKKLRELYAERNRRLGLRDTVKSAFNKGVDFHNSVYQKPHSGIAAIIAAVIILILLLFLTVKSS